jgi:asparagine synthase (glutamine-hydrolysing)
VDESTLDAVRAADAAQHHRGPDGHGIWFDSRAGIALAHRRLAVLDLSPAGAQPMHDSLRGNAIIFNGEIYNYRELRAELVRDGFAFRSQSDTEVILHAYAKWGDDCLPRLRGMFALAIWDSPQQRLVLARDPLGQKPLYCATVDHPQGGQTLLFASELRSLLATGWLNRRIDPVGLASYIWNGFVPGPGTLVRGVRQLPPGHWMSLPTGEVTATPVRYWSPPEARPGTTSAAEVREVMASTVQEHLASDVPLGVFLSGGLDSAAVAALAASVAPERVQTFTVGTDVEALDESAAAARVASALGTHHRTIRITGDRFLASLPEAIQSLDQPTFDGLNSFIVSRAVRNAGVTVALAGTGGDELFGGYASFREIPLAARWSRRLSWVPGSRSLAGAVAAVRGRHRIPAQSRWGKSSDLLNAQGRLLPTYQVRYGLFTRGFCRQLLGRDFPDHWKFGLPQDRYRWLSGLIADQPPLHAISNLEMELFIGDRLLRDTDAAGMAASLEVRLPFVDQRLIAAVAGLPERERFGQRDRLGRKDFLRNQILDSFDPNLWNRPKAGFELPFDRWLRGPLRSTVDAVLRDEPAIANAGLNPRAVTRLWDTFLTGGRGIYWSRPWGLYALLNWCRQHAVSL